MLDDRALASDSQFVLNQPDWQISQPYLAEPCMWEITPHNRLWAVFAVSSERYNDPESRSASLGAFRDAGWEKAKDIGVEKPLRIPLEGRIPERIWFARDSLVASQFTAGSLVTPRLDGKQADR